MIRRVEIGCGYHPSTGHCIHRDYAIERLEGSEWVKTIDRETDIYDYETGEFLRTARHRDVLGGDAMKTEATMTLMELALAWRDHSPHWAKLELERRQAMLDAAEGLANELRVTILKIYAGSPVKIAQVDAKLQAYVDAKLQAYVDAKLQAYAAARGEP